MLFVFTDAVRPEGFHFSRGNKATRATMWNILMGKRFVINYKLFF